MQEKAKEVGRMSLTLTIAFNPAFCHSTSVGIVRHDSVDINKHNCCSTDINRDDSPPIVDNNGLIILKHNV